MEILQDILLALLSYFLGLITGLFAHNIFKKKSFENNDIVLLVVTLVWALSRMVGMINPSYQSSPLIDGLMGMIVGFFYKGAKLPFKITRKEESNEKITK